MISNLIDSWTAPLKTRRVTSLCDWASENVPMPRSVKSKRFDVTLTPWLRFPIEACLSPDTRILTLIKPVQTGGSVVGEILLCHLISNETGDIFYNWEDDEKARDRWDKAIEPMLKACKTIPRANDRSSRQKCLYVLPRGNLTVQGVFTESNLASDSIRFLINEEVHGWPAGRLKLAYNRTRACWNSLIVNISNASQKGDQLFQAWEASSQQFIEVKCPGCGKYHEMHTRWNDKRPELGGLRYDADGARQGDGRYNYRRIAETVRFQMPCGREIPDDREARKSLSLSCRPGEPKNPGALPTHPGFTYDSVLCDDIPWIELIRSKHEALYARQHGNPEPWRIYQNEIECNFYDGNDAPTVGAVVLSDRPKDRAGLPNRLHRFGTLDRQQGSREDGETPHWWLVIRDWDAEGNSLLIYEGKVETDANVVDIIDRHEVRPCLVYADSGDDTTHVYDFCLRNGYNAIKGGKTDFYAHDDGGRRIYGQERPLHTMFNQPPKFDYEILNGEEVPNAEEPMFLLYSKFSIRERLDWVRTHRRWEVPSDVSQDYQEHMESEERRTKPDALTHQPRAFYEKVRKRNDLYVCEAYQMLPAEMSGIIGASAPTEEMIEPESEAIA